MKSIRLYSLLLICIASLFMSCATKNAVPLEMMSLFSNHMVIQQQDTLSFRGKFTPGEKITIETSWGAASNGLADEFGNWSLALATPEAGGPFTISIQTTDSTIQIQDVLAGEVWLASGQSNMQMPLKGWPPRDPILHSADEIAAADYPDIRMFTVARSYSTQLQDDVQGNWEICNPQNAPDFSATAYFFARKIYEELQIPIGIIHSSWGGTVAEAWTSEDGLKELGDFDEQLAVMNDPEIKASITSWFEKWPSHPIPETEQDWNNIPFADDAISKKSYDDKSWPSRQIPGRIDNFGTTYIDGAIWIRRSFAIDDASRDYNLNIGAIDDRDVTFVNGQAIGQTMGPGQHNTPRTYKIPKDLLVAGENIIAMRIIDTGGPGVVQGPIQLSSGNGLEIDLSGNWKIRPSAELYQEELYLYDADINSLEERPEVIQVNQNSPTALYNAMIHPLIPYTIKGSIWYQGESNVGRAEQYTRLFPQMIEGWREKWNNDFSFYYVQIAPFAYRGNADPGDDQSQKLRDAQRKSLSLANTGMAVTLDIGNNTNIHPANKQDVGKRLALWALAQDYMQPIIPSGPLYKSHSIVNGTIEITFDYVGDGLVAGEGGLGGFEISGNDGTFYPAKAVIKNKQVHVSSKMVMNPKNVRYAWQDKASATLFNSAGLPASSFTSE